MRAAAGGSRGGRASNACDDGQHLGGGLGTDALDVDGHRASRSRGRVDQLVERAVDLVVPLDHHHVAGAVDLEQASSRSIRSCSLRLCPIDVSRSAVPQTIVFEEVVAGHDRDRSGALVGFRAQAAKKAEAVDERHSQVQDDGVGLAFVGDAKTVLGGYGRTNLIPFQPQHAGKRLSDALVVVDDENFRGAGCRTRLPDTVPL